MYHSNFTVDTFFFQNIGPVAFITEFFRLKQVQTIVIQ